MKQLLIGLIEFYKNHVSPIMENLFGKACRFTPTCSQYTIEALKKYGAAKGVKLGIARLARCHPFGDSGYDPVPGSAKI